MRALSVRGGATRSVLLLLALAVAVGGASSNAAFAEEDESAILAPLAARSLLLDGAAVDGRIVVVGERGHILVSLDQGRTWTQKPAPTRAMLAGLHFHDARLGWAVGHDAVILRTRDGGETWEKVYFEPEEERPLLDVWFRDANRGFAVGAYGFFLVTRDGGDTWVPREIDPGGEEEVVDEFYGGAFEYHLNRLAVSDDGRLFIAAEAGTIYRSDNQGAKWTDLPSPYAGSFFGCLPLEGDTLLLLGLRGHLFRSEDGGMQWTELSSGTQAMLTDGIRLRDGRILVTGMSGTLLLSEDGGRSFVLHQREDRKGVARVLQTEDGGVLLIGENGVSRVDSL